MVDIVEFRVYSMVESTRQCVIHRCGLNLTYKFIASMFAKNENKTVIHYFDKQFKPQFYMNVKHKIIFPATTMPHEPHYTTLHYH